MVNYFENIELSTDSKSEDGSVILSETETTPAPVAVPTSPEAAAIMGAVDVMKEAMRCYTDYAKCKEHEITERKRIVATLKAVQYQIDAQKEIYLKTLEVQYEERCKLYDNAEKAQQVALKLGDKEMLKLCFDMMLNIYNGRTLNEKTDMSTVLKNGFKGIESF